LERTGGGDWDERCEFSIRMWQLFGILAKTRWKLEASCEQSDVKMENGMVYMEIVKLVARRSRKL
jgi:hypothetical protein